MEERLNYLEQRIVELTCRVSELEKTLESKSAPAGTDAERLPYINTEKTLITKDGIRFFW